MRAFLLLCLLSGCSHGPTVKWVDIQPNQSLIGACATYAKPTDTIYISTPEFCAEMVQEMREKALLEGRDPGEKL